MPVAVGDRHRHPRHLGARCRGPEAVSGLGRAVTKFAPARLAPGAQGGVRLLVGALLGDPRPARGGDLRRGDTGQAGDQLDRRTVRDVAGRARGLGLEHHRHRPGRRQGLRQRVGGAVHHPEPGAVHGHDDLAGVGDVDGADATAVGQGDDPLRVDGGLAREVVALRRAQRQPRPLGVVDEATARDGADDLREVGVRDRLQFKEGPRDAARLPRVGGEAGDGGQGHQRRQRLVGGAAREEVGEREGHVYTRRT